jgi:hypothetical protein
LGSLVCVLCWQTPTTQSNPAGQSAAAEQPEETGGSGAKAGAQATQNTISPHPTHQDSFLNKGSIAKEKSEPPIDYCLFFGNIGDCHNGTLFDPSMLSLTNKHSRV